MVAVPINNLFDNTAVTCYTTHCIYKRLHHGGYMKLRKVA